MEYKQVTFELLAHDTVRVTTMKPRNLVIYFDPFKLPREGSLPKADVLFITHPHYDHCSVEDVRRVVQKKTEIVTVPDTQSKLSRLDVAAVHLVRPGQELSVRGLSVRAVPAYNNDKEFHPKENEWVGFVVSVEDVSVYFAGDTDLTPEMQQLPRIDVAFLPVSGTYVMTAEEAAKAAMLIQPQVAVPMHYGSVVGSSQDAERFKSLLEGEVRVELLH
ncbi:MBL fold metallo-hydrolase [Candidatus Woesearchaeota archaeon]|nr:MBL fold metallo-hydrolase [Candidatus Woesearchaeota archaeon]